MKFEEETVKSDITVLVVPPLALSNSLFDKISQRYNISETLKLNIGNLKDPNKNLILASSFDGILEAKK